MDELIGNFLSYKVVNRNRSHRTAEVYGLALRRFAVFCGDRQPAELTLDELRVWAGPWLFKQHQLGPDARVTHISAVREFYAWLLTCGLIAKNPAMGLEHPTKARKLPRVMTLKNAQQLLWQPDFSTFKGVRDGAMLALLIGCGLRVSGLVRLNQSNVIADQVDGKPRLMLRVTEKGGRERKIPIPAEADLLLRLYMQHPELQVVPRDLGEGDKVLFVSLAKGNHPAHEWHGERRRIGRQSVWDMLRGYGRIAGIPDDQLHPHALRHLFGTELAEADVGILERQKLMGHADPKSTEIYTHLAVRKLTRDVDRANPLGKMSTPVSDLLKRLAASGGIASMNVSDLRGDTRHVRAGGVRGGEGV